MNRQEAFDKAYKGIVTQGRGSSNDWQCLYRGEGGAKCAVGQLLSDEQLTVHKVRNSQGANSLPPALLSELLPDDPKAGTFLSELQDAHDQATWCAVPSFIEAFKLRAADVAKKYKLTVPE